MSIEDIPDLIEEMKEGAFSPADVVSRCYDLFEHNEVDAVLASLPAEIRSLAIADMTSTFDNDIPVVDFLIFDSGRGDHPAKAAIVERVRAWLKARRETLQTP